MSKICFIAADNPKSQAAARRFQGRYGQVSPEEASVIVALGGDGFMLELLHRFLPFGKPIYGINRGSVGFLLNAHHEEDLPRRLERADRVPLSPLRVLLDTTSGDRQREYLAFNEVCLSRQTHQAAKLSVSVNDRIYLPELIGDGALVCTPLGSTAYNFAAQGPVLPLRSNVIALTPIAPFRPRRWRGAILPKTARIELSTLEWQKRPVAMMADRVETRDAIKVAIHEDERSITVLCDPEDGLEERMLFEQFRE